MQVHVALPRPKVPVRILFDQKSGLALDDYLSFCHENPDLRVERSAQGEIIIMPPAGSESSFRNADVTTQLFVWAKKDGRGKAFDSSAQFILLDGSALSPDAAWVSDEALKHFSRERRKGFLPLCPEFVIEVLSPSDRLKDTKAKMAQWTANGAHLAWLIDGDGKTVHVFRPGQAPELRKGILKLAGEGPVKGFTLQLKAIWAGLA